MHIYNWMCEKLYALEYHNHLFQPGVRNVQPCKSQVFICFNGFHIRHLLPDPRHRITPARTPN